MKIKLNTNRFELTSELEKYADDKVAHLGKQLPRHLRACAACTVQFKQSRKNGIKLNTCSVVLGLGKDELRAEETTLHMYAALDITVVHIEQQIEDYLARHKNHGMRTRLRRTFGTN